MESTALYCRFVRKVTPSYPALGPDHIIYIAAFFCFFTGCAAEVAWSAGCSRFLTLGGQYPMYMDTALLCILAGLGLFAALCERFHISRSLGILIALAANVHFAAGITGFSVSVHNLFPRVTAAVLRPAEMHCIQIAPATAVVFFLFGCGLALLSKTTSDQVLGAVAALGAVMASISLIALAGYRPQLLGVSLETNLLARMAIPTILCSLLLGASLCAMLWKASRLTRRELSTSAAALTVIGLVLLFGGLDTALFVNAKATRTTTTGLKLAYGRIKAIKTLVDATRKAEIGQRGFVLTDDDKFLATYLEGMEELKTGIDSMDTRNIPQLYGHDLQNLIVNRTAQLAIAVNMQRRGQHQQAVDLEKADAGLALMNQIESQAAAVTRVLQADIAEQTANRERAIELVTRTVVTSYLVASILIALALYLLWTETKCRNVVEKALRDNEASLEQRVEERTQALHAEIGVRTKAEQQLRKAETLLDAALKFAGIAAWVWDCNEDHVSWTGNMQAVLGRDSSEIDTFLKLSSFIHPNDRSRITQKIATSVTNGADYTDEFRIRLPEGAYRWISGIGGVVRDENGLIIHMAGVNSAVDDVTAEAYWSM